MNTNANANINEKIDVDNVVNNEELSTNKKEDISVSYDLEYLIAKIPELNSSINNPELTDSKT
jgi:hypothetical protein